MDWFSLCLDTLCLEEQSVIHIRFLCRLTGRRCKVRHFAAYFLLLCGVEGISLRLSLDGEPAVAAGILALYSVSRFGLGNRRSTSWTAAVLAFYISQLSFGVLNSVESVIFPRLIGSWLLYPLLLAALAAFFGICAGCCAAVLRYLSLTEDSQTPQLGLLLFPGLFFFAAELYILRTAYRLIPTSLSPEEAGGHVVLLFLQSMGLAALICTLYAYRCLCQGFQARAALQSLGQAARAQRVYIAEAKLRDEQTRAFRHDIKNHLSVLDGLLSGGELEKGRAYLRRLEAVSTALSFPWQTGSPVVDILLEEKLGLAKGIAVEVSLRLPRPCAVDDFDLCVIFANALDNALSACRLGGEGQCIRVTGKRQGDFYMLTFENTCPEGPLPPAGIGLSNIKSAAEKYRGAVLAEKADGRFFLHVLLDISLHPERSSDQIPCSHSPGLIH